MNEGTDLDQILEAVCQLSLDKQQQLLDMLNAMVHRGAADTKMVPLDAKHLDGLIDRFRTILSHRDIFNENNQNI